MWGLLLQTRTSEEFLTAWEKLMLLTLKKPASPIFFQHVTDNIFKQLVKQKYPLPEISAPQLPPLNFEEENAVHYAAGYVIKHLGEKIENRSSPLKQELLLCLQDMCAEDSEIQYRSKKS